MIQCAPWLSRRTLDRNQVRTCLVLTALLVGAACAGCGLTGLAAGQLELVNAQRRVDHVLDTERDPERRAMLEEVPRIRRFAEEVVGMRPGHSYSGYFATEREGMTYVLSASEQTRLVAYTWWFPVAGRVEYRSYFSKQAAVDAAAALQARGYDTWVAPSRAYSTLGFFRDPVSTTMMREGLAGFVEVLLHEMAHARSYAPGHTEWNEALATFVGQRAALDYFDRPRFVGTPWLDVMRRRIANKAARDAAVAATAEALRRLYAGGLPRERVMQQRGLIFARLRSEHGALWQSAGARDVPSNNAELLHALRYGAGQQQVLALWERSGGSFRRFWTLAEAHARTLQ